MATSWSALAQKGNEAARAKDKLQSDTDLAFKAAHDGHTAISYIAAVEAQVAAEVAVGGSKYSSMRSPQGQYHTENTSPSASPDPKVQAYHDLEDAGKKAAAKGDMKTAVTKMAAAEQARQDYANNRSGPSDAGHLNAIATLSKRRASLSAVGVKLAADPRIATARLTVKHFYEKAGATPPPVAVN